MSETTCTIERPHCEACGRTDPESLQGDQGYSACCNELIPYSNYSCRGHHLEN